MRQNKSNKGFTLIELLIVIAIIGILAAVLIPNLMNARTSAAQRAAQAHSSNVYTVFVAALADSPTATASTIITPANGDCSTAGVAGSYNYNAAPGGVQSCAVTVPAGSVDDFQVRVVHGTGANAKTYINGRESSGT